LFDLRLLLNTIDQAMKFDSVLIIGCGYIGRRVARAWITRGENIVALARSKERAQDLEGLGIKTVRGDLDETQSLHGLSLENALLYYFAPPPQKGTHDTRMAAFVSALKPDAKPARCVLISTTGVYGDHGGAWVDESAALKPATDRARRRLDAEHVLRAWGREHGVAVVVLRVAGIYGLDRLPAARIRSGIPIIHEAECPYTNRIHADDLVDVCIAAAVRGKPDEVYNVSDGKPGTMTEYFNAVADALGMPRPPTISLQAAKHQLSPGMLSYLAESRRLDNRKMLEELGVHLKYPNLEAGLAASTS